MVKMARGRYRKDAIENVIKNATLSENKWKEIMEFRRLRRRLAINTYKKNKRKNLNHLAKIIKYNSKQMVK